MEGINRRTNFEGTWPDDLICSGLVQAQLRTKSWVRETLGLGPYDDVTEHAGNVVAGGMTHLVGLGGNVTRGDDNNITRGDGDEVVEAVWESILSRASL